MIDVASYQFITGATTAIPFLGLPVFVIVVAMLLLKGFAMFAAARRNQKGWFWCLLIFNTLGILPAIYLFIHRKKK